MDSKVSNLRLRPRSLKFRLGAVFVALVAALIVLSGVLLYRQYFIIRHSADFSSRSFEMLSHAMDLRELLARIERNPDVAAETSRDLRQFERIINDLKAHRPGHEPLSANDLRRSDSSGTDLFDAILSRFNALNAELTLPAGDPQRNRRVRAAVNELLSSVTSFIYYAQNLVYQRIEQIRDEQQKTIRFTIGALLIGLLLLFFGAYRIIAIATVPLSQLAKILDEVNVEDDAQLELPKLRTTMPEISAVFSSFEQLFQRLNGFRAINIRRLLIEKQRADIIAASIADGIFLLRDDEIIYMNPIAEKILGLKKDGNKRGLSIAELASSSISGESGGRKTMTGAKAVLTAISRTLPVEYVYSDAGGDRKAHYLLQSQPISDELVKCLQASMGHPMEELLDGWQANMLVLAQDVTIVRESQEAKSHFVGTLSHEIKTPVTSLTMATRLLRKNIDQFPNAMHRTLIQTCVEDVDRLRSLLEDLLSVSRFDTLTQRLEIKNVDITKLLKQTAQSFQPQAFERGIQIVQELAGQSKPNPVPMDATKISWALSNLFLNALRHTPRGGKVHAAIAFTEDQVEVSVKDTGPGIEKSRQERIFDKFSQVYDLRIARSGGAGIGLAIAREIIIAHGGRIWVTSELGRGADFRFTLPLKRGGNSKDLGNNKGEQDYGASTRG